jgi:hypothetical protein
MEIFKIQPIEWVTVKGKRFKTFYGRNLQIGQKSWSACPWQVFYSLAECLKVRPGAVFTSFHFLCNLRKMGPNKIGLYYTRLERLARVKHYSLLGPFVSYEENEVLLIWTLEPVQHVKGMPRRMIISYLAYL